MSSDDVSSKVVAGIIVAVVIAAAKEIHKRFRQWRRQKQSLAASAPLPTQPQAESSTSDYRPPLTAGMTAGSMILVIAGLLGIGMWTKAIITIVPQYPWNKPLPSWAFTVFFGAPLCLIGSSMVFWLVLQLRDTKSPDFKPVSRKRVFWGVGVFAAIVYSGMIFVEFDPFGWMAALDGRNEEQVRELLKGKH